MTRTEAPARPGNQIAFLIAPARFGGLESVVEALGLGLLGRGHGLLVLALGDSQEPPPVLARLGSAGADLRILTVPRRRYDIEIRMVRNLLRTCRPGLVHSHGAHADVVARLARRAGIPLVSTIHGFTGGGCRNRAYEAAQLLALRGFDAIVPVSRGLAERAAQAGVPEERISLIRNALQPIQALPREIARRRLGAPETGYLIGWVGRLSQEKGPDLFIDALRALPEGDWQAVVVGDGPMRAGLEARTSADRRVRWAGAVPEASSLLTAFDLLVISSWTEGSPVVLLEAMAAGTPVVATSVGGIPEMVSEREALLVPPGDAIALADAIRSGMSDGNSATRRAAAAAVRVAGEFDLADWLARYESLYQQVLSRTTTVFP